MDAQKNLPKVPSDIKFRVLIIGRANAGKTSILQRVCDTTESPEIYRLDPNGNRERVQLDPTTERGEHNIEDELAFTNHDGYVFHDSRGFEAGGEGELKIVQEFVRRKSREKRLKNRLHAIWYCIPMDNDRPSLDLKYFEDICPDKNVPVIAVFTKYDQFRREIRMKLEDQHRDSWTNLDAEIESIFNQHFLASLMGPPPFIRLERMNKPSQKCEGLIEITANALSGSVVALMLLAVQRDDLELSIRYAIGKAYSAVEQGSTSMDEVMELCILGFPLLYDFSEDTVCVPCH